MKKTVFSGIICLLIGVAVAPLLSLETQYVEGYVKYSSFPDIIPARCGVVFLGNASGYIDSCQISPNGYYYFEGLDPAKYKLQARCSLPNAPGVYLYMKSTVTNVDLNEHSQSDITLWLVTNESLGSCSACGERE